jgi:DNA-binding response OmpR family regulator
LKKPVIWIVEDDRDITELLSAYLKRDGFNVEVFHSGGALLASLGEGLPSIFLVDISLPDYDGISLTRKIRATTNRPVLLVTGRGGLEDRVKGLDAGADDYIVKPFELAELSARVRSNLRRVAPDERDSKSGRLGEFELDGMTGALRFQEREIALTDKEASILGYLLNNPNRDIPRDEICLFLNGQNWDGADRSLDVYLCRIRNKMKELNPKFNGIKTVRGVGYKLSANGRE